MSPTLLFFHSRRVPRQCTTDSVFHADDLKMKLFGPYQALVSEKAGNRPFSYALPASLWPFAQAWCVKKNWSRTCVRAVTAWPALSAFKVVGQLFNGSIPPPSDEELLLTSAFLCVPSGCNPGMFLRFPISLFPLMCLKPPTSR